MERCFIVTKESKYFKDYNVYKEKEETQRKFINIFFNEKGIDGKHYVISGDGFVNTPFNDNSKDKIKLSVDPTENNMNKFKQMLCKPNKYGLCDFKKNSIIGKEFAQKCIDEKIIINLYKPIPRNYFKSLSYYGYRYQEFLHNEILYLKIESEYLDSNEIPEGFEEIKISEYYKIIEDLRLR
jgi:hypothetical protein